MSVSPQPGDRLGRYELLAPIGGGGMGRVFRARDTRLRRDVAVKVLRPEYASDSAMRTRLQREAEAIAALTHPGIVAVFDVDAIDGLPFIVMELLRGTNLRERIEEGAFPCAETLDVARQLAEALSAAHAAGIVHRDLKPENVYLSESGSVKLLDFGLARTSAGLSGLSDASLTAPHVLIGTIRYMSPEQARGDTPSFASDVFSAGLVLYEMATGRYPFGADTPIDLLHSVAHEVPVAPSRLNPSLPQELGTLILQMLAKDHRLRPAAGDVALRLRMLSGETRGAAAVEPPPAARRATVGRATERDALRASWAAARGGRSALVSIAGEPGIGKTTLVADFIAEVVESGLPCYVARGRCSEAVAGAEAYLPILEALETLVRAGGDTLRQALKQLAPTWHLQVSPPGSNDSSAVRLRQEIRSASQQRVKREIRAFLAEASAQAPILLFLDDVHWADPATVDLLAYLARGFEGLRLLVVTAHRVSELLLSSHPFGPLLLDLQASGAARALPLPFLDRAEVERYLDLEFPEHGFPPAFAALVHTKTEGSPLFMVDMLADLRERGVISPAPRWRLTTDMPAIERQLPASIRSMIQRRLDRLSADDVRLLRVCSIQGPDFDSVVVAEAAGLEEVDLEERLESLQRVHGLVRMVDERELPDRTLTSRYEFIHVLYQNELHGSLKPARRAALSAAVARSMETHYRQQIGPVASRIAHLYEAARKFREAGRAYGVAAEHAAQLVAHREVAVLARRGLKALEHLPETPEHADLELALLVPLGVALQLTCGYTSAEGRQTYLRARHLAVTLGNRSELFPSLWGLWMYAVNTGDYDSALRLAEDLVAMATQARPQERVRAAWARGTTALHTGKPAEALRHYEWGLAAYREEDDRVDRHLYGHDAGITCRAFAAWARWMLGDTRAALEDAEATCDRASGLSHPQTFMFALSIAAILHHDSGDARRTLERSTQALHIAEREGFPQFASWSRIQIGWATARLGRVDEGLAIATSALESLDALGSAVGRPYFRAARAEILTSTRPSDAIDLLDDVLLEVESSGEVQHHAELLRLKALAHIANEQPEEALRLLDEAIDIATAQGAGALRARAEAARESCGVVVRRT